MKTRTFVFCIYIFILLVHLNVALANDSIQTVAGELAIILDDSGRKLSLNGRIIPGLENDLLFIEGQYKLNQNDLITIIDVDSGNCSTCGVNSGTFLLIRPDGKYLMTKKQKLSRAECKSSQQGNSITIKCEESNKTILLTYKSNKVTRKVLNTPVGNIKSDNCEELYTIYKTQCIDSKICSREQLCMAHYRTIESNRSNIRIKVFDASCKKACKGREQLSPETFRSKVCKR